MARRKKQQSIIEIALTGNWKVSATFAISLSIVTYIILPAITNPIIKSISPSLQLLGLTLICVFGLVSAFKLIKQLTTSKPFSTRNIGILKVNKENFGLSNDTEAVTKNSKGDSTHLLVDPPITQPNLPINWSLELIREIEWKKFEELCTAYYLEKGMRAEATSLGADGGIDIKIYQDNSDLPTSIAQCKSWNNKFIGVKEIREFLGVMSHEKIAKGFYMTTSEYTSDAKEIAKSNQITLITGEMLLMMIKRLPEESQERLLSIATEGDYTTPSCSSCGVKMIRRAGKKGEFWGCKNYPRCRHMLHIKKQKILGNYNQNNIPSVANSLLY